MAPRRDEVGHCAIEIWKAENAGVGTSRVLRIRWVAVDVRLAKVAKIGNCLIGPRVARPPGRSRRQERNLILRRLRQRVRARPILREHLHRGGRVRAEAVVCPREAEVKFGLVAACAEIGKDAPQRRWRILAPSGIVDRVGREVAGQVSDFAAGLDGRNSTSVRAAAYLAFDTMIGVSILHLKCERTAGRVESVDRITGNERELIDGILRNEVPIDDVAKDLIDTNSILVNGEPFWSADYR